jgi:hypothetical protein
MCEIQDYQGALEGNAVLDDQRQSGLVLQGGDVGQRVATAAAFRISSAELTTPNAATKLALKSIAMPHQHCNLARSLSYFLGDFDVGRRSSLRSSTRATEIRIVRQACASTSN